MSEDEIDLEAEKIFDSLSECTKCLERARCKHPRILRLPASRYLRPLLAFK